MIKNFLICLLLVGVLIIADITDVFAILSHSITLYIAIGVVVILLTITAIVLRAYVDEETQNEEDNK
jgi:predicted tellurium resistance membrane protein TerC